MNAPIIGLSLVGRAESVAVPADFQKWGISSLRLPVHVPLKVEDVQQLEAAHAVSCSILGVLQWPANDSLWPQALPSIIDRFKAFITHWEIGSEPDDPAFGWPADHLVAYAACLIQAAAIIKSIDPQAKIHNGGLGRSLPKGIAQLCERGAGSSIDVWNVHPYMNPLMPDAKGCLRYLQEIIRRTQITQGQAMKPVWWSSIACPGIRDPHGTAAWWLGKNPTEIMQAEWLKIVYAVAAGGGVERIFWEGWQDQPNQTQTGIDYFGLRRADTSAKPVLDALSQLSSPGL